MTPRKPTAAKSQRRRARELALQGLYQWLTAGGDAGEIDAQLREHEGYAKCDSVHFDALLRGSIEQAAVLDAALAKHVDRKTTELSPVVQGGDQRGGGARQVVRRHRRPQVRQRRARQGGGRSAADRSAGRAHARMKRPS
jgi:NusB family